MTQRSLVAVVLLTLVTFGIYGIYWFVSTKGELNQRGAEIPTAWLLIIPFVNIWWMWKYFEGAEKVTNSKVSAVLYFLLGLFVTALIPMAMAQNEYNKLSEAAPAAAPAAGTPPAPTPTAPVAEAAPAAPEAPTSPTEAPAAPAPAEEPAAEKPADDNQQPPAPTA